MATSKITSDSIQDNAISDSKLASTLDLTGKSISMTDLNLDAGYGSTAPVYGVRAWVNFNGTGTVAIRASGNVSSVTDNGTGSYLVNMTNSMPDNQYCITMSADNVEQLAPFMTINNGNFGCLTANSSGVAVDSTQVHIAVIR